MSLWAIDRFRSESIAEMLLQIVLPKWQRARSTAPVNGACDKRSGSSFASDPKGIGLHKPLQYLIVTLREKKLSAQFDRATLHL
jgi:hypothetical protein